MVARYLSIICSAEHRDGPWPSSATVCTCGHLWAPVGTVQLQVRGVPAWFPGVMPDWRFHGTLLSLHCQRSLDFLNMSVGPMAMKAGLDRITCDPLALLFAVK